jgi:Outer membrane protein beta-barrel domain
MRRSIVKGILILVLGTGCLIGEARAQNRDAAWEVFPYLGFVKFGSHATVKDVNLAGDSAVIELSDSSSWGLRFGYHWTKRQMVEYAFGGAGTDGTATLQTAGGDKSADFKADLFTGQANYVCNFFLHHRDKVVAYVTGGLGLLNFSTFGTSPDPDLQLALNNLVGDENDFIIDYGGGIRFFGSEKLGMRIDARQYRYSTKQRGNQDYVEVTFGLTLVLGGA